MQLRAYMPMLLPMVPNPAAIPPANSAANPAANTAAPRRPQRSSNSKYCPQVIWRQWLLHLADEGAPPNPQEFSFPPEETIHNVTFVARDGSTTGAAAAAVGVQQVRRKVQQHLPAQLGFENRLGARVSYHAY